MSEFQTIIYEETDGVAWVTLNRPEAHNAFNDQMQRELRGLWHGLRYNDDVRCIVFTGAGDKAFCTGIDRKETMDQGVAFTTGERMTGWLSSPWMFDDPGDNIGPKSCRLWKPVIAAVNGMACGGAFYMLGETEFIIAAEHATFFDPHVTYGMTAAYEPIHMMSKVPFPEIMRMTLLGNSERLSAQRAYEIGMVSQVVPQDKLRETAAWVAQRIADAPPVAVVGSMRALWAALEMGRQQALSISDILTRLGNEPSALEAGQDEVRQRFPRAVAPALASPRPLSRLCTFRSKIRRRNSDFATESAPTVSRSRRPTSRRACAATRTSRGRQPAPKRHRHSRARSRRPSTMNSSARWSKRIPSPDWPIHPSIRRSGFALERRVCRWRRRRRRRSARDWPARCTTRRPAVVVEVVVVVVVVVGAKRRRHRGHGGQRGAHGRDGRRARIVHRRRTHDEYERRTSAPITALRRRGSCALPSGIRVATGRPCARSASRRSRPAPRR